MKEQYFTSIKEKFTVQIKYERLVCGREKSKKNKGGRWMLVKRSLKRVVAHRGRRRKRERERRAKCENVEEMVRDGMMQKKEEENYGGLLLLCKHRSRELSSRRHIPSPQS